MTTAATTRPPPQGPWSPHTPSRVSSMSSTTPSAYPSQKQGHTSSGFASRTLSPGAARPQRASTPNYFEYVTDSSSNPPNSNAGTHTKQNWSFPSGGERPDAVASPQPFPLESHPHFESFRRQSETNTFNLSHANLSHLAANGSSNRPLIVDNIADQSHRRAAPHATKPRQTGAEGTKTAEDDGVKLDSPSSGRRPSLDSFDHRSTSNIDIPRIASPANISQSDLSKIPRTQISRIDERHPRNSLPHNRIDPASHTIQRSETLPSSINTDGPTMISPNDFMGIVRGHLPQDLLLLDLRVSPQYAKSRITDSLNLCIPTTLLKRSSFNVHKLSETFTNDTDKGKFGRWKDVKFIIVYDASSMQLKDATSSVNTLKKFTSEGWQGATLIIKGGFDAFSNRFPEQVDGRPLSELNGSHSKNFSIEPPAAAPVAGGCLMPATQTAANPFFGNIRQNMDLIGGVGQMPVKMPFGLKESAMTALPSWLRKVLSEKDQGKTVSERFLGIEKAEQQRMQKALSVNVSYGSPNPHSPQAVQIAGIEKGTKNRYKDMLPYDHSRVKLKDVPSGDCDYVNASHIKAQWSNKHYIASQAPVPATFQDFWRVAWEQDARVIVMLTAESESGQRKCHPYWHEAEYGPFKLKALSERHLTLEESKPSRSFTSPLTLDPGQRPGIGGRRHTGTYPNPHTPTPPPMDSETPHVIVRKLTLAHTNHPFEPLREITQLQYSSWPDFGAPAHPAHVLGLVEHCNAVVQSYDPKKASDSPNDRARQSERPIVVHCSAGCGRTGTFCTVDSVTDMLKQQRQARFSRYQNREQGADPMDIDTKEEETWLFRDDEDLVAKTVSDFRLQRLSMVQTLRQFVLCYESVLEWVVGEMPEKYKGLGAVGDKDRRSWAG